MPLTVLQGPKRLWLAIVMALAAASIALAVAHSAPVDPAGSAMGQSLTVADTTSPICRFGVASSIAGYDAGQLALLRLGSYLAFNAQPTPPLMPGMDFVQVIRMHQLKVGALYSTTAPYVVPYSYTLEFPDALENYQNLAKQNPGSVWLVGNEIDRRDICNGGCWGQDEMLPEMYAQAYHDVYVALKAADPTALMANGSMVEVTPLRLKYLDRVWNAYRQLYGTNMPVDVWNMHPYLVQEVAGAIGAEIPAGLTETVGMRYKLNDADNITLYIQQVQWFRQWMASHGEQNKPLYITEMGILLPNGTWGELDGSGTMTMTESRVQNFLLNTFNYMLTTKDPNLGYPLDDNRLIQRWYWYSLGDSNYNGQLFDTNTGQLNVLGNTWATYVSDPARPLSPPVNYKLLGAAYTLGQPDGSGTLTATVYVHMTNSGNQNWTTPVPLTISLMNGTTLGSSLVNFTPGCGTPSVVSVTVPGITGTLFLKATMDPAGITPDPDRSDNSINFTILGNPIRTLLPSMFH